MLFEDYEKLELENYISDPFNNNLFEMANILGRKIKVENNLPFSIYFSPKTPVHGKHEIRLKVVWNSEKMLSSGDGYLELHGNYDYISGSHKKKPTAEELDILRNFAKKYKVLFNAVWEEKLDPDSLQDYFKKEISFEELLNNFEIDDNNLKKCKTLNELDNYIRKNKLYKTND